MFNPDKKYHIEYKRGAYVGYRLRLKREIRKQNTRATVAYNLDLVHYKRSGHKIQLIINDDPSTDSSKAIKIKYHYSVDVIPKPVETTKNHVEDSATDVKELVRSKIARDRVREDVKKKAKKGCHK